LRLSVSELTVRLRTRSRSFGAASIRSTAFLCAREACFSVGARYKLSPASPSARSAVQSHKVEQIGVCQRAAL
jgi:hypothetical protein